MPDSPTKRLPIPKLEEEEPVTHVPVRRINMAPPIPLADVEWRVDSKPYERSSGHVCRYVPYLNAPIVADLFDRWVGPFNWSDSYELASMAGRTVLWCHITVITGMDDPIVTKSDLGVPPAGDDGDLSDKGLVSDAFKRCATLKWGVGRNVYMLPTLWAPCEVGGDGKARPPKDIGQVLIRMLREQGWKDDGTR